MIDNYLLEGLVAFMNNGTLAKTATQLGITQPAVTRNMHKLEDELGVVLFHRSPNKVTLTETGSFAAQEAVKLLQSNNDYVSRVHQFNQNQAQIEVASNAPGPIIVLRSLHLPNVKISANLVEHNFISLLDKQQVTCLLINQPLQTPSIDSTYLGIERMAVNLPADSSLATKKQLSYEDFRGQTLLSPRDIGFWQKIYEDHIPDGKIIYQEHSHDYSKILNFSTLPYFTTNLTQLSTNWGADLPHDRVLVPLKDAFAQQKAYACYLTANHHQLAPLIQQLQDKWATVD